MTLHYPDGPHEAEALLVSLTGQLIVVTKRDEGDSSVYLAETPLVDGANLVRVTSIDVARLGNQDAAVTAKPENLTVTGGAMAADGTHFALRTPTAVYEWNCPDGDIVAALTYQRPTVVELPGEVSGGTVTYRADGHALLAMSAVSPIRIAEIPFGDRSPHPGVKARSAQTWFIGGLAAIAGLTILLAAIVWRSARLSRPPRASAS